MEIIRTTIIRTAHHKTETVAYNIDYSTTQGQLERAQINVYRPPVGEVSEEYLGSVHYDGQTLSSSLRWSDDLAGIFETAASFIAEIIKSVDGEGTEAVSGADTGHTIANEKQR